jgi:hypothetical protein
MPPQSSPQQLQPITQSLEDDAMQVDESVEVVPNHTNSNPAEVPTPVRQIAQQAQDVFAALANFQQEYIRPTKLDLTSSAVEILASSTCGNGESYKSAIPTPFTLGGDWRTFQESFEAAAVKENCADVLLGHKKAPPKPTPPSGRDVPVEEHNEYIKQTAIFRRRDAMLKQGFRDTLEPSLWARLKPLRTAHDIWVALEDLCSPRGSDQAYAHFRALHDITLDRCGHNLDRYVNEFELGLLDYNQLQVTHELRRPSAALIRSHAEALKRKSSGAGNGSFPDEMLCFLFLRNLGPRHQTLAMNLTKTNNIGGFGSGVRVTFRDLAAQVQRAMEWDAQRYTSGR